MNKIDKNQLREELRRVVIIFVDIHNSTKLSYKLSNTEYKNIISEALNIMIERIEQYGGYVDNILGDGILAVFGYPVYIENIPLNALKSIDSIFAYFKEKKFPKGIKLEVNASLNYGEIISTEVKEKHKFTIFGSEVNITAKILDKADKNEILATENFVEISKSFANYEFAFNINIGKAIKIFRLKSFTHSIEQPTTPFFVGREKELDSIINLIHKGEKTIYISGEPGIGKTRLLKEIIARFPHSIYIPSYFEGKNIPFYSLKPFLNTLFGEEHALFIKNIMEKNEETSLPTYLSQILSSVILKRFNKKNTLFILDDFQWIDPYFKLIIDNLMQNNNIKFIIVTRNSIYKKDIHLNTLNFEESKKFIEMYLGKTNEEKGKEIFKKTGGNPLLLIELINYIKTTGDINKVPDKVYEIALFRFDHSTPEQKHILRLLAIWGLPATEIFFDKQTLDSLIQNDFLKIKDAKFIFKHSMIKEAIKSSITEEEKLDIIKELCNTILPFKDKLSYEEKYHLGINLLKIENFDESLNILWPHLKRKQQLNLISSLVRDLAIIKKYLKDTKENYKWFARIYVLLAWINGERGNYNKVIEYAEKIKQLDKTLAGTAHRYIGAALLKLNKLERAYIHLNEAENIYKKENDTEGLINTYKILGSLSKIQKKYDKAIEYYKYALSLLKEEPILKISLMNNLSNVYYLLNKIDKAKEIQKTVIKEAKEILPEEHLDLIRYKVNLGVFYVKDKMYKQALEIFLNAAKQMKELIGETDDVASIYANIAYVSVESNDMFNAFVYFKRTLKIKRKLLGKHIKTLIPIVLRIGKILIGKKLYNTALRFLEKEYANYISEFKNLPLYHRNFCEFIGLSAVELANFSKAYRYLFKAYNENDKKNMEDGEIIEIPCIICKLFLERGDASLFEEYLPKCKNNRIKEILILNFIRWYGGNLIINKDSIQKENINLYAYIELEQIKHTEIVLSDDDFMAALKYFIHKDYNKAKEFFTKIISRTKRFPRDERKTIFESEMYLLIIKFYEGNYTNIEKGFLDLIRKVETFKFPPLLARVYFVSGLIFSQLRNNLYLTFVNKSKEIREKYSIKLPLILKTILEHKKTKKINP